MKDEYKALGGLGTLGIEVVLSILFGSYLGYWGDKKLGTAPALLIVGFGFGCAAAIRAGLRAYREMQAVAKREEQSQGNPAPLFDPADADAEQAKRKAEKDEDRDGHA